MAKINEASYVTLELTKKEFKALKKLIGNLSQDEAEKVLKLTKEEYELTVENLWKVFKEVEE